MARAVTLPPARVAGRSAKMTAVHRLLSILSTALITAGVVILLDVALTLVWKEPLSTVYGSIRQGDAEDSLEKLADGFPAADNVAALSGTRDAERRASKLAQAYLSEFSFGMGIGRIEIPAIGLDMVFVEGTGTAELQKGPGRYPELALPGQGEAIGIAGHRTTYLAPFRDIDDLERGDEVILEMPYATATYLVEGSKIVDPLDVEVFRDRGYERVVLTACHPLYSAAERYTVSARLTGLTLDPSAAG
jgi:sortase A